MVAAEEERRRHVEDFGNSGETPGTYTVDALLVLLHLVEGDPKTFRQLRLRHPADQALCANTAPDLHVTRIRGFGLRPAPHVHSTQSIVILPFGRHALRHCRPGPSSASKPDR